MSRKKEIRENEDRILKLEGKLRDTLPNNVRQALQEELWEVRKNVEMLRVTRNI